MAKDGLTSRPWYRWSPRDFLTDPAVAAMTRRQRMEYREALDLSWLSETPGLATEDQWRKWLGYGPDAWGDCKDGVCNSFRDAFRQLPDGKWLQKRLRDEWLHATDRSRKAKESVDKRWNERITSVPEPYTNVIQRERGEEEEPPTVIANAITPSTGVEDAVPRPTTNGPANPPRKARKPDAWDDAFDRFFWPPYPRKVAKAAAQKSWSRIKPAAEPDWQDMLDNVCGGLQDSIAAWKHEQRAPDKIPHASTWLNQRRWEDETT